MDDKATKIRQLSLDEDSYDQLVDFVHLLSGQGLTRQNIYDLYLKYLVDNRDSEEWNLVQNKFSGDHPVELILDRLSGWCRPDLVLLPNEPFQNR